MRGKGDKTQRVHIFISEQGGRPRGGGAKPPNEVFRKGGRGGRWAPGSSNRKEKKEGDEREVYPAH